MRLDPIQLHTLLDLADGSADEVCGVLLGRSDPIVLMDIVVGRNVHAQPQCHFLLDAASLLHADERARSTGTTIIGFYHSHPNGCAAPSLHDRADAWPNMITLIIGGGRGRRRYACAWIMRDTMITPEPIDVIR